MISHESHADRYRDPNIDPRYDRPECDTCGICRLYRDERIKARGRDWPDVIGEFCIREVLSDPDGDLIQVCHDDEACSLFAPVPVHAIEEDEVLLRQTDEVVLGMPVLECSNCGFRADHYFFYSSSTYDKRIAHWCPNCQLRILGIAGKDRED